jgi:hypothetical protein
MSMLTAILDSKPVIDHGGAQSGAEAVASPATKRTRTSPVSGPGRVLLATLSFAAGAIHLVMVPSHSGEWLAEGLTFAAVGWLQIGLGVVFVVRPSRAVLRVSCLANAAFIAAWIVSRVSGLPFGPRTGIAEAASFVDITCVALEALLVIVGGRLLMRPDHGSRLGPAARAALSIVPIGILAVTTAAIVSPSALNHAHHDIGTESAAGATGAHGHSHNAVGAEPIDDKGLSKVMNGQGEGGGHAHTAADVGLDPATQRQLDAQLAQTRLLVDEFPTVRNAEAAGYLRSGPFSPGLGAHYTAIALGSLNTDGKMDVEDLAHPTLIYDGIAPDSRLAGFMYNIASMDTEHAPAGFAGANDHWHYHTNVCIAARPGGGIDAPLGADTTTTQELCDRYGGFLIANTGYMLHVWVVPGYASPQGVFSNVNGKIKCADGTYHIIRPEDIGHRTSTCSDA